MEQPDAILEQLKRAQTSGLETLNNRLDIAKERIADLIEQAKTSVADVAPEDPSELFQMTEVESSVHELLDRAVAAEKESQRLADQVAALQGGSAPVAAPAGEGIDLELLRRLDKARSQSELLQQLLPLLCEHAGRAVVLVIRGESVSAWSGAGFADSEKLRTWQAEVGASEILGRFAGESSPLRFAPLQDPVFSGWLSEETAPKDAILLPVCLRGKVMGGIYVDSVDGRPWQPELAQALVALTCWFIDTLPYRQTVPSPMLAELVDLVGEDTPQPEPEPEGLEVVEEPEPEVLETVEEPEPEQPEVREPELPAVAQTEEFDPTATVRVELPAKDPEPAPDPAPSLEVKPPVDTPPEEPAEDAAYKPPPVQPVVPPPDLEPVPTPVGDGPSLSPEEEARHEEARRFARLLVSEIKLYNEDEVDRGRASKDIYHRLKEDIDRSREMFEKRIPPEVRTERDYFHDELVKILADGDTDALGM